MVKISKNLEILKISRKGKNMSTPAGGLRRWSLAEVARTSLLAAPLRTSGNGVLAGVCPRRHPARLCPAPAAFLATAATSSIPIWPSQLPSWPPPIWQLPPPPRGQPPAGAAAGGGRQGRLDCVRHGSRGGRKGRLSGAPHTLHPWATVLRPWGGRAPKECPRWVGCLFLLFF
jgi:hypothetical protein